MVLLGLVLFSVHSIREERVEEGRGSPFFYPQHRR
jgi:hypothetical protein